MEIFNRGEGESESYEKLSNFFNSFFKFGDFFILNVSWPKNARNWMKKDYPTGHVKKLIFSNFGGGGYLKSWHFLPFSLFLNPSLKYRFGRIKPLWGLGPRSQIYSCNNFYFLTYAVNQFLHGISTCVENFYWPTIRWTNKVRYRCSFTEFKKIKTQR